MASPPTTSKVTSRWGSFLAGVESKLDTILADESTTSTPPPAKDGESQEQPVKKEAMAVPVTKTRPDSPSRPPSTSKAQDRLNERLAKAVANRNLARKGDGTTTPSSLPSRTASPANVADSPRTSSDSMVGDQGEQNKAQEPITSNGITAPDGDQAESQPTPALAAELPISVGEDTVVRLSMDSRSSISARPSAELTRTSSKALESPMPNDTEPETTSGLSEQYEQTIEQMRADNEAAELRRQEETHDYLERIDALQSKLQYLSKEAAEMAKSTLSEAKPGSIEQKLAIKDEKIALLIEEGQKLSQAELKHMSIIKKLRAKSAEDETKLTDTKRLVEKHEKAARDAQERVKRAELAERRATEKMKMLPKLEKELESVKLDREANTTLIQDLQRQLSDATSAARESEAKAQAEALEFEQRLTADLKDEISNLRTEKEMSDKQHRTELRDLQDRAERERERAKIADIERQGEQNILESRLEAFRARVEEASAGTNGDVHAKLLRQIETLQNQYAVASENWQGIEGSLLARITALERERDEIAKREGDVRRKARETNTKSRRLEDELERAIAKSEDATHELQSQKSQLATLQGRLKKSEADIAAARQELLMEREASEARQARHADDSSARTPDNAYQPFRTESPPIIITPNRKASVPERPSPHSSRRMHGLAISGTGNPTLERPVSRRSSTQPFQSYASEFRPSSSSRMESLPFVPQVSINGGVPESPSVPPSANQEDFFDEGARTPATPERTINDMISGSTAGAGPSVQLVERMSAAVRRLESEKAASREEVGRLCSQRDEARDQVVSLMQEAEGKRAADERARGLEKEVRAIEERYLTTLEMLGEKSEAVEELKADVVDLKELYRELVEKTMR